MVDRIEYDCGISSIGDRRDIGEFRVKESSKKKRRPEVSLHIKDWIASLLPEESSESPVRKFLKYFSYNDPEDMVDLLDVAVNNTGESFKLKERGSRQQQANQVQGTGNYDRGQEERGRLSFRWGY